MRAVEGARQPLRVRGMLGRWVLAFTLGELVGFGLLPASLGSLAAWLSSAMDATPRALLLYGVAIVTGFGEGAVLARFQLRVLRDVFPGLDERSFTLATGVAASVAWAAGMLVPTLDDVIGLSAPVQVASWIAAALVILPSIGIAQARALRGVLVRPGLWIAANVLGWLLGLPWTFVCPALVPDGAPLPAFVLAMVVGGVAMGATAGLVTGLALARLAAGSTPRVDSPR